MKKFQITIPEPCHEKWTEMSQQEKGRFCNSCQKTVVDFTNMNDRQLAEFFKKPAGSVCGRFMHDQLERDISLPKKRIPWLKYFFQFTLPAFLISMKATAQGKPVIETVTVNKQQCSDSIPLKIDASRDISEVLQGSLGMIAIHPMEKFQASGKITDHMGLPIKGVSVIIKNSTVGTVTDEEGNFKLSVGLKDKLFISSIGFESKEVNVSTNKQNIVLEENNMYEAIAGLVITTKVNKQSAVTEKEINVKETAVSIQNRLSIYPNPVAINSIFWLRLKDVEPGEYKVDVLSSSGELISSREVKVDQKNFVFSASAANNPAGVYIARFTNSKTGKVYSEKLVMK